MIKDTVEKIEWLLTQDVSSYEISRRTGVTRQLIDKYRGDLSTIKSMKMETAEALENFAVMSDYRRRWVRICPIEQFKELDEVQLDESPSGQGVAIFYNDGFVRVSVDIPDTKEGDQIFEEERFNPFFEELKSKLIEELLEQEKWN